MNRYDSQYLQKMFKKRDIKVIITKEENTSKAQIRRYYVYRMAHSERSTVSDKEVSILL